MFIRINKQGKSHGNILQKRKSRPIRCCLSFFALVCCSALGVGFYGNHELHAGLERFSQSMVHMDRLIVTAQKQVGGRYNDAEWLIIITFSRSNHSMTLWLKRWSTIWTLCMTGLSKQRLDRWEEFVDDERRLKNDWEYSRTRRHIMSWWRKANLYSTTSQMDSRPWTR